MCSNVMVLWVVNLNQESVPRFHRRSTRKNSFIKTRRLFTYDNNGRYVSPFWFYVNFKYLTWPCRCCGNQWVTADPLGENMKACHFNLNLAPLWPLCVCHLLLIPAWRADPTGRRWTRVSGEGWGRGFRGRRANCAVSKKLRDVACWTASRLLSKYMVRKKYRQPQV